MTTDQVITVITGVFEAGGLGVFLFVLIRGLKSQISLLKDTLDAMERRLAETEKVLAIYKSFLNDLDFEKYRAVVLGLRDEVIAAQEKEIRRLSAREFSLLQPAELLIETLRPESIPVGFATIIQEMQKVVIEFETNKTPDSERRDIAQKFLEKHERELAKIADVSPGNVDVNLELGELLLKGGYYEKALELYERCLAFTERGGWVLLRLAEACDRLGKTDEALGYVRRLGEILKQKETKEKAERDDVLYHGGSYLAWKYNLLDVALLDVAVLCGEQSVKLTKYNTDDMLKRSWNLIYYKTEQIVAKHANDWGKIEQYLVDLSQTVQSAEHMMNKHKVRASLYDSRSWYYAMRAESEYENGKKPQACKDIKLAEEYLEKCFVHWNKYESAEYDVHTSWRIHSIKIKELKERIEPFC